jgi:hypothetical protein
MMILNWKHNITRKKGRTTATKTKMPQELGEEGKVALKAVICTIIGIVSAVALAGL